MVKEIQPQPQPQAVPDVNINITDNGVIIGSTVNQVTTLSIFLDADTMMHICRAWLESRQAIKSHQATANKIRNIKDLHD